MEEAESKARHLGEVEAAPLEMARAVEAVAVTRVVGPSSPLPRTAASWTPSRSLLRCAMPPDPEACQA